MDAGSGTNAVTEEGLSDDIGRSLIKRRSPEVRVLITSSHEHTMQQSGQMHQRSFPSWERQVSLTWGCVSGSLAGEEKGQYENATCLYRWERSPDVTWECAAEALLSSDTAMAPYHPRRNPPRCGIPERVQPAKGRLRQRVLFRSSEKHAH